MEILKIENLTFTYPNSGKPAISNLSFTAEKGQFITLCGMSGCGKTTLLRHLKPCLAPFGEKSGSILFNDSPIESLDAREQASRIGFVQQNPDNQIVTDKVWHELAFGLESLGFSTGEIRSRIAEMASFFGIQTWFDKNVSQLSGGQKQLLNLASVMAMQPSVLILDEPTSQLDPIAAQEFLETLAKINRELGTTIILSEHRLEDAFPISDRVIVMENGSIITDAPPRETGTLLKEMKNSMFAALPTPMRIYYFVDNSLDCPVTVREGRKWLDDFANTNTIDKNAVVCKQPALFDETAVEVKNAYFRYEKEGEDVIKDLSVKIGKGEFYAIVGGNGTGKTTALSLMSGLNTPYSGKVLIFGTDIKQVPGKYSGLLGVLPQNPQSLFVKKTLRLDLYDVLEGQKLTQEERKRRVAQVCTMCGLTDLIERHPYDLSGGEQQRAALAKILLLQPQIILMDEPTKGLDADFKQKFSEILTGLRKQGVTVIMVSHDIEFCAKYADRCAMFFNGKIMSEDEPHKFFSGKNFYTTAANRMARGHIPEAVLAEDVISACGGNPPQPQYESYADFDSLKIGREEVPEEKKVRFNLKRILWGAVFLILFAFTQFYLTKSVTDYRLTPLIQIITIAEAAFALYNFIPDRSIGGLSVKPAAIKGKLSKRTIAAVFTALIAVPITVLIGVFVLQDRKYYFISLLIILETLIPFALSFEGRSPRAREIMVISVLCAIAVAGREIFFMLPQFKPVAAVVIIAGVCFGAEAGFLTGAVSAFVSNMFMMQGAWTPWQMFAFGMVGFIAGLLFSRGILKKTRLSLCVYGGLSVLIIYGLVMNTQSLMFMSELDLKAIISVYLAGIPFDLVHACATAFFLWFIAEPMIEKLERIKIKYGLLIPEKEEKEQAIIENSIDK